MPDVWLDVDTMADLDDVAADFRQRHGRRLRIATKYWRLTQQFFSQKHGIQVYRIVESLGATEGAPAAGLADVIVDITTTGSTLRANHLKVLADGVILRSQACLVASRKQRGVAEAAGSGNWRRGWARGRHSHSSDSAASALAWQEPPAPSTPTLPADAATFAAIPACAAP